MKRLRVAFLDHTAEMGGGEHSLLEVVASARSFEPIVILGQSGDLERALAGCDVQCIVEDLLAPTAQPGRATGLIGAVGSIRAFVRWAHELERILTTAGVEIVVANSQKSGVVASITSRRLRMPFVWSIRDRLSRDYFGPVPLAIARTAVYAAPDLVIANSQATAETCPKRAPIRVIPPSVRPIVTQSGHHTTAAQFAMVARLTPWKGQDRVIRTFARSFPGGSERLRLIGGSIFDEEAYERDLVRLVTELDLTDRVEFTGHVDDVAAALTDVDVVVHATAIPEPFGRSLVEAMSAGLPVIAEDAGGPSEIITHDVDGLLVPHLDDEALGTALRRMATDEALRSRLGAAAVRSATRYTPRALEPMWSCALQDAIELHAARFG